MRGNIIGQDQDRRATVANEIARHRENEIGVGAIHPGQKFFSLLHADVGPPFHELGSPAFHVVGVEQVAHLGPRAGRLRQHGGHDTIRRPLQEIPDHGTADAEAEHHEPVDAQIIHQPELVIGVGVPWAIDLEGARRLAAIGVAEINADAAVLAFELVHGLERRIWRGQIRDGRIQPAAGDHQERKA
jgi:hypothetical protein